MCGTTATQVLHEMAFHVSFLGFHHQHAAGKEPLHPLRTGHASQPL